MAAQTDTQALRSLHAGTSRRPPWTIPAFVLVLIGLRLAQFFANLPGSPGPTDSVGVFISLFSTFVFVSLFAYGLSRGSMFVWVLALLWSAETAALGAYNLVRNDYGWNEIAAFQEVPFFFGALPIITGALNAILLLLASTLGWVRRSRG